MAGVDPGGGRVTYAQVLRLPGVAAFCATGAVARLPQAMIGLGTVLMLVGLGRSYTLAGLVAGTVALAQGATSPWLSRLIDRRRQHEILLPQTVLHAAGLAGLVTAGATRAEPWVLVVVAAVVGATMPQFGACTRARWTALLAHDAPRLQVGLSAESLVDEAVFIVGPVLATALCTTVAPAAGLVVALAVVLVGGLTFGAQRRTEPPTRAVPSEHPPVSAIRHRGLVVLVGVFAAIGALFGLVEVGVVALARASGQPGAAGLVLGLWASGSLVCGAWYGSRRWRTTAVRRFQLCTAAMAVGCALVAAVAPLSLVALTAALVVAGLATAPTLITGNTLVAAVVPAGVVTEAYTWLGVAVFAGVAVGTPTGGALVDHVGPQAALAGSVVAGAIAALVATTGRRALGGSGREHGDRFAGVVDRQEPSA